jgi:hypothetical protein
MKKSEAINIIKDTILEHFPEYQKDIKEVAELILSKLEEEGMTPPLTSVLLEANHIPGVKYTALLNKWDEENEKK